ncbi:MAG: DUF5677 domain-containing protein [Bacilli bacterium]|nr:DUF5677 domain-containing protein [Bacilli bacterium]
MDEKTAFLQLLGSFPGAERLDKEFLYRAYQVAKDGVKDMQAMAPGIRPIAVNPLALTLYLINEHSFYLSAHPENTEAELVEKDDYLAFLASIALDKYTTNEHLAYRNDKLTSRFSPFMSTIELYLNFILGMLSRYKKNDPKETLVVDIMNKGFSIAKCVAMLLEGGFETEAFSTWRTLHENECILHVLTKNGPTAIEAYLRHMTYAAAFRGAIESKEATDKIFVEIKENMHGLGLKSKDMKRYIEYGWLYSVKREEGEDLKLNFRDGVQRCAGLSDYSKIYEMSSEIAHSSPLLIYSRKNYIFHIALLNLYESFFRLERVFTTIYMSTITEEERQRYVQMRNLYYWELQAAYRAIQVSFAHMAQTKRGEDEDPTIH